MVCQGCGEVVDTDPDLEVGAHYALEAAEALNAEVRADRNGLCSECANSRELGSVAAANGGILSAGDDPDLLPGYQVEPGPDQLDLWEPNPTVGSAHRPIRSSKR